jgi:hypothetical protein
MVSGNFAEITHFLRHLWIFYMPQIYEDFFSPKNPKASAGFEPAILGTRGQSGFNYPRFTAARKKAGKLNK